MKLNERLRALRRARKMTLKKAAYEIDISISYLSDIERGRTLPSLDTCRKIVAFYEMNLQQLFDGVEL